MVKYYKICFVPQNKSSHKAAKKYFEQKKIATMTGFELFRYFGTFLSEIDKKSLVGAKINYLGKNAQKCPKMVMWNMSNETDTVLKQKN